MRSLDPRVRYVWAMQALVAAAIFGALAGGVAYVVDPDYLWVGGLVFVGVGTLTVGLALARYRVWRYQVRSDSLFLHRGVLTRVRTVVPYVRIQHVDSNRGPVERVAGLATVVVYTAGSRGADVTIPGLTPEQAEALQERLKRLAIVAEGEDAV
ncbi:PH domain-containing protein [Halomarina rubra]|uniref:PH domain-containing protein n=1 Tax=Halomarina rubra TaxID=2071873 RepID=A0ABD6B1E3_9EURY|nr:PH domain-containing protein [Halomarina rubra]